MRVSKKDLAKAIKDRTPPGIEAAFHTSGDLMYCLALDLRDARELLEGCEWRGACGVEGEIKCCPICGGSAPEPINSAMDLDFYYERYPEQQRDGHFPGCRLAAVIGKEIMG